MLPPFIIEQIRRREEAAQRRKSDAKQPRLELPLDVYEPAKKESDSDDERQHGVIIVEL